MIPRSLLRAVVGVLTVAFVLLSPSCSGTSDHTLTEPRIAFVSCDEAPMSDPRARQSIATHWSRSVCALDTVRLDGSDRTELVEDVAEVTRPVWSPDGDRIAFSSARENTSYGVHTVRWDGGELHRVTDESVMASDASWSPDGGQVTYSSYGDSRYDIFVADADGSDARNLTDDAEFDTLPLWSPDGSRILFRRGRDFSQGTAQSELWVVDATGGKPRQVAPHPAFSASWSPDGKRVAYTTIVKGETRVVLTEVAGGAEVDLGTGASPTWSPDGTSVAFFAVEDGETDVYVADADGSDRRNISNRHGEEQSIVWVFDGEQILFSSNPYGNYDLFRVSVDGSRLERLTRAPSNEVLPSVSPRVD